MRVGRERFDGCAVVFGLLFGDRVGKFFESGRRRGRRLAAIRCARIAARR